MATVSASYHRIPTEVLLVIFEYYYESMTPGFHIQEGQECELKLAALLAPLYLDSRTREALWESPRIWRSIASCLNVEAVGERCFDSMLGLCDQRTGHTLKTLNTHCVAPNDVACLDRLLRRFQVIEASSKSLRRIHAGIHVREDKCGCRICLDEQLELEPLNYIFRLISKAPSLQTLGMFLVRWPDSYVLKETSKKCMAKPTRLQLCIAYTVDAHQQGRKLWKHLSSQLEHLLLSSHTLTDEEKRELIRGILDEDELTLLEAQHGTEVPVLYNVVLESAAKTLRHLEFTVRDQKEFPRQSFVNSSFESLETLFVHFPSMRTGSLLKGDLCCHMPSLKTMVVPAGFLPLIHAASVTRAGLTVEDSYSVAIKKSLAEWSNLSILTLHILEHRMDSNELLRYLTPQMDHQPVLCPKLEGLGIYSTPMSWTYESPEVEDMPRRWDWRELSTLRMVEIMANENQEPGQGELARIGNILARMIVSRQKLSEQPEQAEVRRTKALREIRVIGYEIDPVTWKTLIDMPKIPRLAIWPRPPTTRAVMLWNKVTPEGKEGIMDDLDEPSESIYYVPSW